MVPGIEHLIRDQYVTGLSSGQILLHSNLGQVIYVSGSRGS